MSGHDPEPPAGRQDNRFFSQDSTKAAIVRLADAKSLIIYCGSGVTIDRTGLSWGDLVGLLLRPELLDQADSQDPDAKEKLADRRLAYLKDHLAPSHVASILSQVRASNAESNEADHRTLVRRLRSALYQDNGWQSGVLVKNIIRLAFAKLAQNRRVVIVTSNFDDYLEQGFVAYCNKSIERARETGAAPPALPGIRVTVLARSGDRLNWTNIHSAAGAGQLELVYVHGRVHDVHAPAGQLVLGECDYALTQSKVVAKLTQLLRIDNSGVLILGSSMTDLPLLSALADTTDQDTRYALVPVQSTGMIHAEVADFKDLLQYTRERGLHFKVQYLVPDFHYQIAQFCEEVLTAVGLDPAPSAYLDTAQGLRYGLRLVSWWERWSISTSCRDSAALHGALVGELAAVRQQLDAFRTADRPDRELMKLELWVRNNPKDLRQLCLWGSTAGPLVDTSILRNEPLRIGSGIASVRAFVEGRPQLVTRETLAQDRAKFAGPPASPSRWNTFLSVPIRVDHSAGDPGTLVGLPVGVVTLASMSELDRSDIPRASSKKMSRLAEMLLNVGLKLLTA